MVDNRIAVVVVDRRRKVLGLSSFLLEQILKLLSNKSLKDVKATYALEGDLSLLIVLPFIVDYSAEVVDVSSYRIIASRKFGGFLLEVMERAE